MKKLLLCSMITLCLSGTAAAQTPTINDRAGLRGLPGVLVVIESFQDANAESRGLTESQLQTDVELRLRKAAIRVLTIEERKSAGEGRAMLYVNVKLVSGDEPLDGVYAYSLSVEVWQQVLLVTPPFAKVLAISWHTEVTGIVGKVHLGKLREDVGDLVDKFINDYLAANPPKSKAK